MNILFLTTALPNKNTAVGNVEYSIIKHLLEKNNIDEIIYLGQEEKHEIEDIGIKNTYYFKLTTKQRIIQILKHPFKPCMMIFRKNKSYIDLVTKLIEERKYDLVFVTYSQLAFVGKLLRDRNIPSLLLIYDVLYQSFLRKTKNTKNIIKKVFYLFEKKKCQLKEASYYNQFDNLVCLTNKDKKLLYELKCNTKISVMQTCYHDFGYMKRQSSSFQVCYFAAYDRSENVDAINNYINNIHHELEKKYHDYKFIIMGKDAEKVFESEENIEVLGFQEHPEEILNQCSMSILPIRCGAGVKTKVLELLALGIPCICSEVASEGIDDTYGLETYTSLKICFELVDKWYHKNIYEEKDRIRKEFLEKYPASNTFSVIDELMKGINTNV